MSLLRTACSFSLVAAALCRLALAQDATFDPAHSGPPGSPTAVGAAFFTESEGLPRTGATAEATALSASRTPIHSLPDDPTGGAYGTWAAGTDYKASFHDGFTFVPYLGSGYPHNQPLSWRTTRVTVGGREIVEVDAAPEHSFADYRYEYRFAGGDLVEAYDVLPEGVEQTFTLAQRPAGDGDLVIEGRITTRAMDAVPTGDRHGPLSFRDAEGRALVRYGEAWAVDARRDRVPVSTSFDGQHIRLRVPAHWLRAAAFPVTVDPLLTRECIASFSTALGMVLQTDICRDDWSDHVVVTYTRAVSATDTDLYSWLFTSDSPSGASKHAFFSELTSTWGATGASIGYQGGANRWVLAYARSVSSASSELRIHLHDSGDLSTSGTLLALAPPTGFRDHSADVGGTRAFVSSDHAMIVFERDATATSEDTVVYGAIVNAATDTLGTPFVVSSTGTRYDAESPAINQVSAAGGDGWMVVYQLYDDARPNDDWDVVGRRYDDSGRPVVGLWAANNGVVNDTHRQQPRVEGLNGRYLVTFTTYAPGTPLIKEINRAGETITAERLDWPAGGVLANGPTAESVRNTGSRRWQNTGLAFDDNATTLWCAAYHSTVSGANYAATVGICAGTVDSAANSSGGVHYYATAATYNNDLGEILLSYSSDDPASCGGTNPVYAQVLTQFACSTPATATIVSRPTHIPGSTSTNGPPHFGKKGWNVFASDPTGCVPRGAAVFFLVSGQSTVPGPMLGGWGCGVTPGEANCFGAVTLLLNGDSTWDGATPVGFAAPIDISSDPVFCGAPLCVQPLFATVKFGVDVCELLEVTVGV